MKIARWDDDVTKGLKTNRTTEDMLNMKIPGRWSVVPFMDQKDPQKGWAVPFVTGHSYRINWGDGLKVSRMKM